MARKDLGIAALLALALAAAPSLAAPPAAAPARAAEGTGARAHQEKGVACAGCHGKAKPPVAVEAGQCLSCHGPASALVAKTAQVKHANPHDSPHWGAEMECNVCHRQHEQTVDWCAYCHGFDFKVP